MNPTRNPAQVADIEDMRLLSLTGSWVQPAGGAHHMLYVLEGRALFRSPSFDGLLNEGEMAVLPSGAGQFSVTPVTEPTSAYYIRFAAAHVARECGRWSIEDASPAVQGIVRVQPMPLIRHKCEHLHRLWMANSPGSATALQIGWLELWETIRKGMAAEEPGLDSMLQGMIHHMDLHSEEAFQVEQMARHSGVTPAVFYKRFKQYTSLTPLQYITRNRMEKARRLLVQEEANIREVASEVGYPDVYYFSRIFKKAVGIPPYRYHQLLRRKIAVTSPPLYDNLLALGVPREKLIPFWNRDEQKNPYRQHDTVGIELHRLLREKPELIIGTDKEGPLSGKLADIAPLETIKFKPFSWRDHLRELAAILNVGEVAEYWLYYYERKADAVRERIHQQLGEQTVLAALMYDRNIRVYGKSRRKIGRLLYDDLKLNAPTGTDQFVFADIQSLTELNEFKADHILLFGDPEGRTDRHVPISGRVHHASIYPWLHYSAIGHERSIEQALLYFSPEHASDRNVHPNN